MSTVAAIPFATPRAKVRLGPVPWRAWILGTSGVGLLLLGWTLAAYLFNNAILVPTPWAVSQSFVEVVRDGTLSHDVAASLQRVFIGFGIAACLAIPLALAMASFPALRELLLPVLSLLRPIPPIAWIPLAILWFGIGNASSYFITTIAAFFPIFLNAVSSVLAVEQQHLRAARCLGANRLALVLHVYLPSSLPTIWTGLKIGLGQSWMAVVTAELIAAQSGLGYMIELNRLQLETSRVFVGMLTIGAIGALMTSALGWSERFIFPWKHPR
jgi:NitT/TauT family transport system permease protein